LGDTFDAIEGVVSFRDGLYRLAPRSNTDIIGHADTCGSCEADTCIWGLAAGDLVINELMTDPDACGDRDNAGEYIEVYNATSGSVDLNCLVMSDAGDAFAYIESPTIVSAGGYAVLQRRGETYCYTDAIAASGAAMASYRKSLTLNNDTDTITLSFGDIVFDEVSYVGTGDDSWPLAVGVSMGFNADLLESTPGALNDDEANWCLSLEGIGSTSDLGTPGTSNGSCTSFMPY
jgi:hypothetical protein